MQALCNHITDDLICENDFMMTNGAISIPKRAGLGITLDEAAMREFSA